MRSPDDVVIRVEGLGKRYRLGRVQSYKTLRDSFAHVLREQVTALRHLFSGQARRAQAVQDELWALRDLDFDVRHGEAVGIIGGNGAGKSTLLKVLSRITEPTTGQGWVRGRVGSLLEVGTGFHPELTGRENIYLNGAILGMTRAEIRVQFDAIVSFAGVERFVDTPVKHYSSGMYMRLAFSVAAHLEPDVLMVDEVLAVGDVAFQKKCLGRMNQVAGEGRTVLFVSHNMAQMQRLCERVIWLSAGRIAADGPAEAVIGAYLASCADGGMAYRQFDDGTAPGDEFVKLRRIAVCGDDGQPRLVHKMDDTFTVVCECEVRKRIENLHLMLDMYTQTGVMAFGTASFDALGLEPTRVFTPGRWRFECRIPPFLLNCGAFAVSINAQVPGVRFLFRLDRAVLFEINELGGAGGAKSSLRAGVFRPKLSWQLYDPSGSATDPVAREPAGNGAPGP